MRTCCGCTKRTIEPRCHNTCEIYKELIKNNEKTSKSKNAYSEYYAFTQGGVERVRKMKEGLK